jgi:hypothetical protein
LVEKRVKKKDGEAETAADTTKLRSWSGSTVPEWTYLVLAALRSSLPCSMNGGNGRTVPDGSGVWVKQREVFS